MSRPECTIRVCHRDKQLSLHRPRHDSHTHPSCNQSVRVCAPCIIERPHRAAKQLSLHRPRHNSHTHPSCNKPVRVCAPCIIERPRRAAKQLSLHRPRHNSHTNTHTHKHTHSNCNQSVRVCAPCIIERPRRAAMPMGPQGEQASSCWCCKEAEGGTDKGVSMVGCVCV